MTPRSQREVPGRERAHLEHDATYQRNTGGASKRPTNAREDAKLRRIQGNKILVRGRYEGSRLLWDVLRIHGKKLELAHAGCWCQEEAFALASDAILNRVSVSLSGLRTVFPSESKAQGLATPRKGDLILPGDRPVQSTQIAPMQFVIEGKSAKKEKS